MFEVMAVVMLVVILVMVVVMVVLMKMQIMFIMRESCPLTFLLLRD